MTTCTFDPIRTPSIVKHFLDNSNVTEPSVPENITSTTPVSPPNAVLILNSYRPSNKPMVINFEGEFWNISFVFTCNSTGGILFSPEKAVEEVSHVLKTAF